MRETIEQLLHFQCAHAYPLPLNPEALCRALGLELRPLSEISRESGMSEREICACWGNEAGVPQRAGGRRTICYNARKPPKRVRFTLCEEISHDLLGHLDEPGFSAFSQDYREEVYQRCEEEARFAAGLLLCPPRWYFAHERELDERSLARRCGVSSACARRILADYAAYGAEIRACPTFGFAPINGELRRKAPPGKNSCKSGADTVK
jgi:hypothetical protein